MKIQVLSDIHLETNDFTVPRTDADVIVLAGDIGAGSTRDMFALISGTMKNSPEAHVVYVIGNHELYGWDINSFRKQMREKCGPASGYEFGDVVSKFHFLDNDEIIINGVRFLGTTLWTDFQLFGIEQKNECMSAAERCLNDFRRIKNRGGDFTPQDSIILHNEAVAFLEAKLNHESFDGSTVVVTHHAPSFNSVATKFKEDDLSACFASNLDHLMGFNGLWIHGHMHDSFDYEISGTRVICNPRGYSRYENTCENQHFKPTLTVGVGETVLEKAASLAADNQAFIDAITSLKKQYSKEHSLSYYDLSQLPEALENAYWETRSGSTQPAISQSTVYSWDWEEWRDAALFRMGVLRKGSKL